MGLGAIVAGAVHLHRKVVALEGLAATWVALVSIVVVSTHVGAATGLVLALVAVVPYVVVSGAPSATLVRLRVPSRRRLATERGSPRRNWRSPRCAADLATGTGPLRFRALSSWSAPARSWNAPSR